jgi:hypothetical protein
MRIPIALGAAALSLLTSDASACKCLNEGFAADLAQSTTVFVGRLTDVKEKKICPKPGRCESSYKHVVVIEGVWKGSPAKTVTVHSGASDDGYVTSCAAWTMPVKGARWVFFLNGEGPTYLRGSFCRNTQLATPAVMAEMTKLFGAPKPP